MNGVLGIVHGIDFLITCFFLGTIIFRSHIVRAGDGNAQELTMWRREQIIGWCIGLLIVSAIWMILVAADMSGSWSLNDLAYAITTTTFGKIQLLKLFLLIAILSFSWTKWATRVLWLAFLLPLAFSLTGHAGATSPISISRVMVDVTHLIAVSIWTGGLVSLYLWLSRRVKLSHDWASRESSYKIIRRFSHFAMASTAVIAASGIFLAVQAGVNLLSPWKTLYGEVLLAKVLVFVTALAAAGINQFIHLRHWHIDREFVSSKSVRREVRLEIILVITAFLIAGFLTRLATPI